MTEAASPYRSLRFKTPAAAASALAEAVATDLRTAIAARGTASIALAGGTTPARFLSLLSTCDLPWPRVHVTLTDERWVPEGHPRANATMLRETLLRGPAAACAFQPLFVPGRTRAAGMDPLRAALRGLAWPLDIAVLGMGEDGHVASLFAGGGAWDTPGPDLHVVPATSPGGEERVSLTLTSLRAARHRYLLFHGTRKLAVLEAPESRNLPVGALLEGGAHGLCVYVAEEV